MAILFGCFLIFVLPNCGDKTTPEEKAIERARIANMEVQLRQAQLGDILEFEDGRFYPVTHLVSDGCRFTSLIAGQSSNRYYGTLAHQVVAIHKRGTPRWKELCVTFMTPPYYD